MSRQILDFAIRNYMNCIYPSAIAGHHDIPSNWKEMRPERVEVEAFLDNKISVRDNQRDRMRIC